MRSIIRQSDQGVTEGWEKSYWALWRDYGVRSAGVPPASFS